MKKEKKEVLEHFKTHKYAFLPPKYSSSSAVDIFGDYVVVVSQADIHKNLGDTLFTVIINQQIADAFRIWFKLMWGLCGKL